MSGRLPEAPDAECLWRLMMERRDAIGPIPEERWDASEQLDPEKTIQSEGGFLEGIDQFDPTFFGISPREAEDVDPQQRLMLEAAYCALEDAGAPMDGLCSSQTGVYVGAWMRDYSALRTERSVAPTQHSQVGTSLDMIATRVSYFFGLRGPSMTVETGCSSSLVGLDLACQALRAGDVEGAIVGGVNVMLSPSVTVGLTHFGGLSPEARCKAFSDSAKGFVRSEGVVAFYLKTLERAKADGDRVHGVIVRSVVNNDGGGDSVVTPCPEGQEDLLRKAYGHGIPLDKVAYLEAHGTGTGRGDPVEARAIGRVIGQARSPESGPVRIGSIKTNVGHTESVAGLAGLMKVLLALKHGVVPPSLHSERLNPDIPFDELNVEVVREPFTLPSGEVYVGVSSFGWGGTNAHIVVTRGPDRSGPRAQGKGGPLTVPFSAHSEAALKARAAQLAELAKDDGLRLEALAGQLGRRSSHHALRAAVVAEEGRELGEILAKFADDPEVVEERVIRGRANRRGKVAFVFPGQGSQWADMGKTLFAQNERFAATIQRCATALQPYVSWNLVDVISGGAGEDWLSGTDTIQPTLWAMCVALTEMWREAGIEPDVVIGHSMGEVAAATAAGVLSYEDAARVIARRSALAQSKSGKGQMLAVDLSIEAAREALAGFEDRVSLAVNNGPSSCVLSGDTDAVLMIKELLEAEETFCRLVRVDFASHCHHMDEFNQELFDCLEGIDPHAGHTALMSTVLVREVEGTEMDAHYWVKNLREPVLFADAMTKALEAGVTHVIEVSPHPVLTPAIEQLGELRAQVPSVLGSLRRDQGTLRHWAETLGRAYVEGLDPFASLPDETLVRLPDYPWQRQRFWFQEGQRRARTAHPFEIALTPSPVEHDVWEGRLELDLQQTPWLRDHQVHESTLFPGAGMMALAVHTARARLGRGPGTLAKVRFVDKLLVSEEPALVTVVWRDDITEGGSFELLSRSEGSAEFTRHASARIERARPVALSVEFPEHLLSSEPKAASDFYGECEVRGLRYGAAFQGVTELHAAQGESLGRVSLAQACRASLRAGCLHTALWDGGLQVALELCAAGQTVVPTSVERVHFLSDASEPVAEIWAHATHRDDTHVDLVFYDGERTPLLAMENLELRPLSVVEGDMLDSSSNHYLVFEPEVLESDTVCCGDFVVCGMDRVDPNLVRALAATGASARALTLDAGPSSPDPQAWIGLASDGAAPECVVFMAPAESDPALHQRVLIALTALVRGCTAMPAPPRVVVVTTRARAVQAHDIPIPESGLYWGFTRVMRREHPELRPTLVDVDSSHEGWLDGLARELTLSPDDDQVALRGVDRFVGALRRDDTGADESCVRERPWRTPPQPFRLASRRPGFWDALEYRPLARRAPDADEVEIEVAAAALNFIDVMKVMGTYPGLDCKAALLGGECAGRVVRVGANVRDVSPGERVAACAFGAFSSHVTLRANHVQRVPAHLTDEQAASLPLVMATAWYALHDLARLQAGDSVLVHSAAGGLGLAAIQIAKLKGARILATAGSEEKRQMLREMGVEDVFHSRDTEWAQQVLRVTDGRGVDVVLNSLTGAAIQLGLDVLAEDGCFVEVGKKDIYGGRHLSLDSFRKGIRLAAVDLAGLMDRRPERFARLFADVWQQVAQGKLEPMPITSFAFADAAEALRAMSRGQHIGKFVLSDPRSVQHVAPEPLYQGRFRADGSYVISGGLGALGLSWAEHMAARGAGGLLLLGRRPPSPEAETRIRALRAAGVKVETASVDVADIRQLRDCLTRAETRLPPVRGVVHAAGLLDDATIQNLTADQLQRVLAPKMLGARNLHELTLDQPLDLFVMFSSAAALVGNAGQAAYAAGNACMDSLAEHRRAKGLPALCVHWGPFREIGLAAQDDARGARLAERGMGSFTAEQAWRVLDDLLQSDTTLAGYVPIDLRRWFDAYPDTAALRSWQWLRQIERGEGGQAAGGDFAAQLRVCDDDARQGMAEAKVRELAGRVLRLDPSTIECEMPFKALGLDSLMGLELRNRLESTFGLRLSPTLLWTYGNSRALAGVLCERMSDEASA